MTDRTYINVTEIKDNLVLSARAVALNSPMLPVPIAKLFKDDAAIKEITVSYGKGSTVFRKQ